MALQVWLPLNGNLNNQGLATNTFSNKGSSYITVDNSGKIGKCYNFNSTANNLGIYSADGGFMDKYINNKSWTICAWVQTSSSDTIVVSLSYGLRMFVGASTYISLYNSSRSVNCTSSVNANDGKWHHLAATYNVSTNTIKFYVDGVNTGTQAYTSGYTYASSWVNGLYVGKDPNDSTVNDHYLFKGKMNDVRIYDHALSPREVSELAKGLVLHYPLNRDGFGLDNILKTTYTLASNWVADQGTISNGVATITPTSDSGRRIYQTPAMGGWSWQASTTYTVSVEARSDDGAKLIISPYGSGAANSSVMTVTSKWKRYSYTFTSTASPSTSSLTLNVSQTSGVTLQMRRPKMEISSVATPWITNSADTEYSIFGLNSTTVPDTSGYVRNGTANNDPTSSFDTPRYLSSICLDGVNQTVQMPNLSTLITDGIFTANIWFKKVTDGWGTKSYETIFGGPSGFELEAKNSGTNSPVIRAYNWGGSTFSYTLDVWHMLTMVRTTEDTKFYLDGELKLTGTAATIPSGNYFLGSWRDTTSQNYKGQLSDFRLYATALTADQVKQLYEAPISLANNGTLFANEFNET